jgi:ribose/xylose/arabinose/galactoside ABC-type transport system permease subunit
VLWRGRDTSLVVALDWLMLARTTALGFGYLPARGISMPPDLAWLRPVFRNAVTPLALLTILVILLMLLLRRPRAVEDVEAALSDTRATG